METCLYIGTFDSERFWRDSNRSQLPSFADRERAPIVKAMDELLFPLCVEGDVLITRYKMNAAHKQYLGATGFNFINNEQDLDEPGIPTYPDPHVIQCLCNEEREHFRRLLGNVTRISPYSILPLTEQLSKQYKMNCKFPAIDVIKQVNSKVYSHQLLKQICPAFEGEVIRSADELRSKGMLYLQHGPFLIKDAYGVSGKGNLLIAKESILQKISSYLQKQERSGAVTEFVIEPFLDKRYDFSSQFHIGEGGEFRFLSVQTMINERFAYLGSQSADEPFLTLLDGSGYFYQMEQVAQRLYADGYFGDVCVDSMMLSDGRIVPIVEINARKSMGLLNHALDRFLVSYSLTSCLTFFSMGYTSGISFEDLLAKLEERGLLFKPDGREGIIPLGANTLFKHREMERETVEPVTYKGRLYVSAASRSEEGRKSLLERTRNVLLELEFQIYN